MAKIIMSSICRGCGKSFKSDRSLHAHLKAHKLKIKEYYYKYFPRRDRYDNKLINFINKDNYLSSDFNNKTNLKKWMAHVAPETAKAYFKNFLLNRKEKKDLEFAPCQVELRSLMSPSVTYYQKVFGDYNEICEEVGLSTKYETISEPLKFSPEKYEGGKIYIDTREQRPLVIDSYPTEVKGLKYGDYAFSDKDLTCNCYIERKSIQDLIGTLSGGYERFCDEIERAETENANFIVLVESDYNASLMFHKLKRTYKNIKTNPQHIFHNIRTVIQEYPNVQFLFVKDRQESVRVMKRIFFSDCEYAKVDLQYAYDSKLL
tara:strand:+ start:450 stop:1403 length:954 start_codon:yes stop_codon:yes gene_type:complete